MQLTVPLREITLKKTIFSPPLVRAHEHAFTFGSSTSTFFQLHIVNCTALGEEKVKAASATLRLERCKSHRRTSTAVKTGICTVDPDVDCNVLCSISAFAFYDLDCFPPRVGLQLVPCVYLYQVQYDLQNLLRLNHITSLENNCHDCG